MSPNITYQVHSPRQATCVLQPYSLLKHFLFALLYIFRSLLPDQSKLGELDGVSADATGRRSDQDVAGAARAVGLGADGLGGLPQLGPIFYTTSSSSLAHLA